MGLLLSCAHTLVSRRNAEINCNIKLSGNYLESIVCFIGVVVAAANQNCGGICSRYPHFSIVLWRIVLVQTEMSNNKQHVCTKNCFQSLVFNYLQRSKHFYFQIIFWLHLWYAQKLMCHPSVTNTTMSRQISKSNKCQISRKSYQRVLALWTGSWTDIGCVFITPHYESNNGSGWGYYDASLESMYFAVCICETCWFLGGFGGVWGGLGEDREYEKVEIYIINS